MPVYRVRLVATPDSRSWKSSPLALAHVNVALLEAQVREFYIASDAISRWRRRGGLRAKRLMRLSASADNDGPAAGRPLANSSLNVSAVTVRRIRGLRPF